MLRRSRRLSSFRFSSSPTISGLDGRTALFTSSKGLARHRIKYFHSSPAFQENNAKGTSTCQLDLPELELPSPVSYVDRTTALLTKSEAQKYLYPLYTRGWRIKSMATNEVGQKSPFLVDQFTLKGPKSARKLLNELMVIEEQEQHHVSFNLWSDKRPVLTVIMQTHSARKFSASMSGPDSSTEPGITLRDIRFAVLLERFLKDSKLALPSEISTRPAFDQSAWEELLSQYPWQGFKGTFF